MKSLDHILNSIISSESNRKVIFLAALKEFFTIISHVGSYKQYNLHTKAAVKCSTVGLAEGHKTTISKQS